MRRTRNAELAADLTAETFAAALVARARRRLGLERIELTDADIERIDALGSDPRAEVLLERLSPEQRGAIRAHVIDERP